MRTLRGLALFRLSLLIRGRRGRGGRPACAGRFVKHGIAANAPAVELPTIQRRHQFPPLAKVPPCANLQGSLISIQVLDQNAGPTLVGIPDHATWHDGALEQPTLRG